MPELSERYTLTLTAARTVSTDVSPTGHALLSDTNTMATITIAASNSPHGVIEFQQGVVMLNITETTTTQLTIIREFGTIGEFVCTECVCVAVCKCFHHTMCVLSTRPSCYIKQWLCLLFQCIMFLVCVCIATMCVLDCMVVKGRRHKNAYCACKQCVLFGFLTCLLHVHHMPSHASHMQGVSPPSGAVEVTYRASAAEGSSATADEDFLSQDLTVTFSDGEESKVVDIPVIDVSRSGCGCGCARACVRVCMS